MGDVFFRFKLNYVNIFEMWLFCCYVVIGGGGGGM